MTATGSRWQRRMTVPPRALSPQGGAAHRARPGRSLAGRRRPRPPMVTSDRHFAVQPLDTEFTIVFSRCFSKVAIGFIPTATPSPARQPSQRGYRPRVRPHRRFRNSGTGYVSESGITWMGGGTQRRCDRALCGPRSRPSASTSAAAGPAPGTHTVSASRRSCGRARVSAWPKRRRVARAVLWE